MSAHRGRRRPAVRRPQPLQRRRGLSRRRLHAWHAARLRRRQSVHDRLLRSGARLPAHRGDGRPAVRRRRSGNGAEACLGGTCVSGPPAGCDDGNLHGQSCPGVGCQITPVADGLPCDDLTVCNGAETCLGTASGAGHTARVRRRQCVHDGSCDGVGASTALPDGSSCDDATVCNGAETCSAGVCQPGSPLLRRQPCTDDAHDDMSGCFAVSDDTNACDDQPYVARLLPGRLRGAMTGRARLLEQRRMRRARSATRRPALRAGHSSHVRRYQRVHHRRVRFAHRSLQLHRGDRRHSVHGRYVSGRILPAVGAVIVRRTRAVRRLVACAATVVALACTLGRASATTLVVDDDNVQCPTAPFHTVNAALAGAQPGDEITLCAGTYAEQIVLTASHPIHGVPDGFTLPVIADQHAGRSCRGAATRWPQRSRSTARSCVSRTS